MEDRLLVDGLRSGDPGAVGAVYDAYADRLYDYCWFQLRTRETVQLALRDALLAAEAHIGELRSPERLGPWLYALARIECRRRRPPGALHPDLPVARHDQDDVDLRVIAWRAVTGLPALSQELLDLHHRHSLGPSDIAGIIGLPAREVADLIVQARELLEASVIAEILAHEDAFECDGRAAILRHRRGELGDDVREALVSHGIACDVCAAHLPRTISAAKVCALLPHAAPPDFLRRQITGCFTDPRLAGYRLFAAARLRGFGARGFPRQHGPGRAHPPVRDARWPRGLAAAAGAVVTAVGIAAVFPWIGRDTRHAPAVAGGASPPHTRVPSPGLVAPPAVGRPVAATFALDPRAPAMAPAEQPAPLAPAPGDGWIYVVPARLSLAPGGTGVLTIQAVGGGAAGWHAAVTGAATVEPAEGPADLLPATVHVQAPADGPGEAVITFWPGGARVVVDWSGPSAPPPSSPSAPPTRPSPPPSPPTPPPSTPAEPTSPPPSTPAPPSSPPPSGRPSDPPPSTPPSSQSGPPERRPAPEPQSEDRRSGERHTGDGRPDPAGNPAPSAPGSP
ncbi:RNA polymerase sigma factor [Actinoallomurus rhizosphaericola]|uniref:RNA polymerase sigma factor n=1 Tax=Actinoallomurus rhizosphaericola TaxID=2952536 RepID=UPI002091E6FC|nr:hypothetical protein [Actinoallomurus rhizosphaericola]MCO6000046.1 hypothetical protein [Actinoallomurus rhizosphaericola]